MSQMEVFSTFLENDTIKVSSFCHDDSRLVSATFDNSGMFGKILNPVLIRCEKLKNERFLSNQVWILTIFD